MSGHSKWSTIKRQKGVADIKRGLTFTKFTNAITIAVKIGGSVDPNSNSKLRSALESAHTVNMPKDNVQRAIDRGLGKLPGQNFEEVLYEGFGPSKVAYLAEGVTDNKLRTNQEIKNIFEKCGGHLGGQGSVAYMFNKNGEIKLKTKGGEKDDEILELIDLGAEEVEDFIESDIQKYLIYVPISELNTMSNKVTQSCFEIESSEVSYKPIITVDIQDIEAVKKVIEFTDKLEELDDIQRVYANFDIPDELLANL